MLKVDSPYPNAEKMPNCPTRNEKLRARSESRKRTDTDFTSGVSWRMRVTSIKSGLYTLSMVNLGRHVQHAQSHRAIARAIAAASAENLSEFFRIDGELVQDALALARRLRGARVMARCVRRERGKLARIPSLHARVARRGSGIHDIEAVTSRARQRTGPAADARECMFVPEGILEMRGDKRAHRLRIEFLFRACYPLACPLRFLRLGVE